MGADPSHPYVSRGGLKLSHALKTLGLDVSGMRCVDLGCSTGGFTDCLLQHGAARVVAVDTAYGVLDYRLRTDPHVIVRERTNALHAEPKYGYADLVTIDMGWTPQRLCVPAALKWVDPMAEDGQILTLIKPHYEAAKSEQGSQLAGGVLAPADAERVVEQVVESMPEFGVRVLSTCASPITGSKGKRKGNLEWFALLAPARDVSRGATPPPDASLPSRA